MRLVWHRWREDLLGDGAPIFPGERGDNFPSGVTAKLRGGFAFLNMLPLSADDADHRSVDGGRVGESGDNIELRCGAKTDDYIAAGEEGVTLTDGQCDANPLGPMGSWRQMADPAVGLQWYADLFSRRLPTMAKACAVEGDVRPRATHSALLSQLYPHRAHLPSVGMRSLCTPCVCAPQVPHPFPCRTCRTGAHDRRA